MIENHTSVNLYNELFSESSEEKCMTFESVDGSLIVHKYTIKNCSYPCTLFASFISFFIKSRTLMQFLSQASEVA